MKSLLILFLACIHVPGAVAAAEWQPGLKTFSHAIKAAYCPQGKEIEIFSHTGGPGVITEQWFTGGGCFGPNTIVNYYLDGDEKPTIAMNLYFGHGIGFESSSTVANHSVEFDEAIDSFGAKRKKRYSAAGNGVPWGTRRIGHLASSGGLYNTIRMPFQKSIRVSFVSPTNQGYYWFIIRGAENYPIVVGDLVLPKTAMLKLHKQEHVALQPEEYTVLATSNNSSGLLYQVTLAASSANFQYLEACFRALIDDDTKFQFLSSGTEDFFLSAFYYDEGLYHTDHAALTYKKDPGTMSAYKFFEDDPVAFSKSFKLIWRCGEAMDNECFKLSNQDCFVQDKQLYCKNNKGIHMPRGVPIPLATKITTYVWTYEWPNP